jgi:hypothetical protein
MPLIRQEEVYPAAQYPWAQAVEMVANGAVARYDLVVVNSVAATGSVIPKAAPADANVALLHAGIIMVATGAAADGEKFLAVPWVVITGVDTNAATAAGYPVYLSTTAGGWTVAKPSGANEAVVPVGTVLVKDATDGAVMLKPGTGALEGFTKVGTAAVVTAGVTVALGPNFANGKAVVTWAEAPGADQSLIAAINGSGDLVITPTAAVTGSKNCTYVAYSGAL